MTLAYCLPCCRNTLIGLNQGKCVHPSWTVCSTPDSHDPRSWTRFIRRLFDGELGGLYDTRSPRTHEGLAVDHGRCIVFCRRCCASHHALTPLISSNPRVVNPIGRRHHCYLFRVELENVRSLLEQTGGGLITRWWEVGTSHDREVTRIRGESVCFRMTSSNDGSVMQRCSKSSQALNRPMSTA